MTYEPQPNDHPIAVERVSGMLQVTLSDGRIIATPMDWYPRLAAASVEQLRHVEFSPAGLHWPDLDEDLSVNGLLHGYRPSRPQPTRHESAP